MAIVFAASISKGQKKVNKVTSSIGVRNVLCLVMEPGCYLVDCIASATSFFATVVYFFRAPFCVVVYRCTGNMDIL